MNTKHSGNVMPASEKLAVFYGLFMAPIVMLMAVMNHYLGTLEILNEDFTRGLFVIACAGLLMGFFAQMIQCVLFDKRFSLLMLFVLVVDLNLVGLVVWYFIEWK